MELTHSTLTVYKVNNCRSVSRVFILISSYTKGGLTDAINQWRLGLDIVVNHWCSS